VGERNEDGDTGTLQRVPAAVSQSVSLVLHLWSAGYQHQMRISLSKGQVDVVSWALDSIQCV
jgi:hypothetical protein